MRLNVAAARGRLRGIRGPRGLERLRERLIAFSAVTRSSPTTLQSDGSCPDFLAIYWRPRSMDSACWSHVKQFCRRPTEPKVRGSNALGRVTKPRLIAGFLRLLVQRAPSPPRRDE
jgi:hypothetical protein